MRQYGKSRHSRQRNDPTAGLGTANAAVQAILGTDVNPDLLFRSDPVPPPMASKAADWEPRRAHMVDTTPAGFRETPVKRHKL